MRGGLVRDTQGVEHTETPVWSRVAVRAGRCSKQDPCAAPQPIACLGAERRIRTSVWQEKHRRTSRVMRLPTVNLRGRVHAGDERFDRSFADARAQNTRANDLSRGQM